MMMDAPQDLSQDLRLAVGYISRKGSVSSSDISLDMSTESEINHDQCLDGNIDDDASEISDCPTAEFSSSLSSSTTTMDWGILSLRGSMEPLISPISEKTEGEYTQAAELHARCSQLAAESDAQVVSDEEDGDNEFSGSSGLSQPKSARSLQEACCIRPRKNSKVRISRFTQMSYTYHCTEYDRSPLPMACLSQKELEELDHEHGMMEYDYDAWLRHCDLYATE